MIRVAAGMQWPVMSATGLLLAARRIEVDGSAAIVVDCRDSAATTAIVFAGQVLGDLQAVVATAGTSAQLPLGGASALGAQVMMSNGQPVIQPIAAPDPAMTAAGSPLLMALVTTFTYATLWLDSDPATAASMFSWIQAMTAGSDEGAELFAQSAALGALLAVSATSSAFVPQLSQSVYTDLATAYAATAAAVESQMRTVQDDQQAVSARIDAANGMLASAADQSAFATGLIAEQQASVASAQSASDQAVALLTAQGAEVDRAKVAFQNGLAEYQANQQISALFTLYGVVVDLAAAIPGFFVFGLEAQAAAQAAEAAAKAGDALKNVAASIKAITSALASLSKVYQLAQTIASAAKTLSSVKTLSSLVTGLGPEGGTGQNLLADADWQIIQLQADSALKTAVTVGVPGASDYQLALDKLVVYGRTCVAAQVQTIQASQRLADLLVQSMYARRQVDRVKASIAALQAGQAPDDDCLQQLFLRYLDAKGWLFLALRNYILSYQYWALQSSSVSPSMLDDVAQLQGDLAAVQQDRQKGLLAFKPQAIQDKVITIDDPDVIAALRAGGSASFPVTQDAAVFHGWDRVRLDQVRFWIEGAKPGSGGTVYVGFNTSSTYQDRLDGRTFTFTSLPLPVMAFQYRVDSAPANAEWTFANGTSGHVEVDGAVADEEKYAYFEPTPFTTWTITISPDNNPGVDLSGVESIQMQVAGSGVASSRLEERALHDDHPQ